MAHVEPLPPDAIRDPELARLIARCAELGVPDAQLPLILARVPEYAKPLLRAMLLSHAEGNVDHRLKEMIRVQLARIAGDPYFAALRSKRAAADGLTEQAIEAACNVDGSAAADAGFSAAEKLALRYAKLMYLDSSKIDAAFYAELKQYFTEAQIMELGAFIAFHYGMQVFTRTLAIKPAQL